MISFASLTIFSMKRWCDEVFAGIRTGRTIFFASVMSIYRVAATVFPPPHRQTFDRPGEAHPKSLLLPFVEWRLRLPERAVR